MSGQDRAVFQMMSGFSLSRLSRSCSSRSTIMLTAQRVECLVRPANIGRDFLDGASQLLKPPGRFGADFAHLAIDRHAAVVVGGERDPLRRDGPGNAVAERHRRRLERHRVRGQNPAIVSRNSARSATLRAIGPCTEGGLAHGAAGHPAGRRPQPEDRAVAARAAQRTTVVGALRQPDSPVATDTAPPPVEPPEVNEVFQGLRPAEHLVEGAAAGAEFRRVRLAPSQCCLALDALDQRVRFCRPVIGKKRRAVGRAAPATSVRSFIDTGRPASQPV